MEIHPISPADASEVKQLLHDVWVKTYPNEEEGISYEDVDTFFTRQLSEQNIQKFKEKLENLPPNDYYFVAKIDGKIVGVTEIAIEEGENKFNNIAVLPEYQGKGVGYALWQKAYEKLKNANTLILYVARYNTPAINFYKRLGFVEDGTIPVGEEFILRPGFIVPEIRMVLRR